MRFMEEQKVVVLKLSSSEFKCQKWNNFASLRGGHRTGVYDGMNCTQDIMYMLPEKLKSP